MRRHFLGGMLSIPMIGELAGVYAGTIDKKTGNNDEIPWPS